MELESKNKVFTKLKSENKALTEELPGRIPPQAVDLEEAILGALMLEQDAINDVIDVLKPESFYKEAHQKIYHSIIELFNKPETIDILTVTEQLKKNGHLEIVGGPIYISKLTNRVASAANVEYHARIVSQKHILRELIKISSSTIKDAFDDTTDVFELLDRAEQNLFSISEGNIRKNFAHLPDLMKQAIEKINEISKKEGGVSGIETGFHNLDKVTSGFQPSDLVILAARPGMGKTAFVLSLARNTAVDFKRPVAIFSLEMSSLQLVNRLIASESELSSEKLRKGQLEDYEWHQLYAKTKHLSDAPLFIDDTPSLSVFELRAKCRRLKAQHDIQMIIIDYLQLMTVGGGGDGKGNREQEISTISRSIKSIAKELDVPVIALSQLNRSVETRSGNKKPQLSDLRESGAIEQDADMVMFIYRPEYYQIDEFEDGTPADGKAEIIIAKHRNGALEDIKLQFLKNFTKFTNLDDELDTNLVNIDDDSNFTGNQITRLSKMDDFEPDDSLF